jgi:zinc transport system substrate-binding protein
MVAVRIDGRTMNAELSADRTGSTGRTISRRSCSASARALRVLSLSLILLVIAACRRAPTSEPPANQGTSAATTGPAGDRINVFVSILPEAYFVERVGGQRVEVNVLVGPGQEPHSYEPTPGQMSAMAKARLFFRTGMPFEEVMLPKLAAVFQGLEIVDLRRGITLRKIEADEVESEAHGEQHGHELEAGGNDPNIWLAPKLVMIQARTVADTLSRADSVHAEEYRRNAAAFEADLTALDARLTAALAPVKGKELFVFHPAFGYFADAYGLKQVSVEIQGKEATAKDTTALIKRAREGGARVIFVQPQFSSRLAEVLAEQIGGAVVPLDDLPRDYLKSMESMAEQVRKALGGRDAETK